MTSARSSSSPDVVRLCAGEDGYAVLCDDGAVRRELKRFAATLAGEGTYTNPVELRANDPKGPAIYWKGRLRHRVERKEELVLAFEAWIYRRLPKPTLHAAVLSFRGRVALFVGESGAGKSVLALTLVKRGWTYLSDEFAPLDRQGRVIAVPRPVFFDAAELPAALARRLTTGNVWWRRTFQDRRGRTRTSIAVVPQRRAESGTRHPISAVFELERRPGASPRLRRLASAAQRTLLFAARTGASLS